MKIRQTIASGACAALLLAGAALAQHGHAHGYAGKAGMPGHDMAGHDMAGMEEHLASALNLTDAQKASAKQLHEQLKTRMTPLFQKMRQQHDELKALLDGANPDATEVGQKVIAAHDTRNQLKTLHEDFANRFSALLNADQKAKFQQMRQKFEDNGPGHPGADF
jgi:Spy/CpxP family protein refolding chaperone